MRTKSGCLVLGACLLLLAAGAPRALAARHALPLQAGELTLSPEEAVIAIQPLELVSSDLPAGYSHSDSAVDTPVSEAVAQEATGADPYASLNQATAEGTEACSVQAVMPPAAAAVTSATLSTCLMSDATSAQNVVQGEARALSAGNGTISTENVPGELVLGDGSPTLMRVTGTDQSGHPTTDFDLRWSRGLVAFELRARAAQGQENAVASASLGQSIDAGEGTRAAVTLPVATVPAPVTEAQRLYDVLGTQTSIVPASQPPVATSAMLSYQVQLPAEAVLGAANPRSTLLLLDQTFQRADWVNEVFRTTDKRELHGQRVTVDASPAGAAAELRNANSDGFFSRLIPGTELPMPNGTQTDTELTPLVPLGDGARAFTTVLSYPNPKNNFVTYTMRWTHGSTVLQARIGAGIEQTLSLADLTPWIQQVESAYQASSLAGMMRLLYPNGGTPALVLRQPRRLVDVPAVLLVEPPASERAAGRRTRARSA